MAHVHQILELANKRELARRLKKQGFKASGESLARWARNKEELDAEMERAILEMFGQHEAAPAWWAEAAEKLVSEIVKNRTTFQEWAEAQAQKDQVAMLDALRKMTDDALARIARSQQSQPNGDRKPNAGTQGGGGRDQQSRRQPKRKEK